MGRVIYTRENAGPSINTTGLPCSAEMGLDGACRCAKPLQLYLTLRLYGL